VTRYEYDDLDNLTEIGVRYKDAVGTLLPEQVTNYTYFHDGTRQSTTLTTQNTLGQMQTWQITYEYHPSGQMRRVQFPWQLIAGVAGGIVNFDYDDAGRLLKQRQSRVHATYTYNGRGFQTGLENSSRITGFPML
jgi:hypothetical protein